MLLASPPLWAALDPAFVAQSRTKIDSVRKRDVALTVANPDGSAADLTVIVKQIRHHFGFGAAIGWDHLVDNPGYAEAFLRHFEWAVFENDLKWPSTDPTPAGPDYAKPDSLLAFCERNDIQVRGHNLFWNQQEEWFPTWTLPLNPTDFKAAVDARIENAMGHYKGKLAHWDVINEIIHGSVLQEHSGDPQIIVDIFKKARAADPETKLTVNDFNVLVWNDGPNYINNVRSMIDAGAPIDIVGCEGHFGDQLGQDYAAKLEAVAALNLPIWITELDFSASGDPADEFEKLMRTFFGHPQVEGVVLWVWWEGNKWREELNSAVVNLDFQNNAVGNRFQSLKDEWTTVDTGTTDAQGRFAFRGYQGRYEVTVIDGDSATIDTLELLPAAGAQAWSVVLPEKPVTARKPRFVESVTRRVSINGMPIVFKAPPEARLTLNLFDAEGRRLRRLTLAPGQTQVQVPELPMGGYQYRIEAENREVRSGIGMRME